MALWLSEIGREWLSALNLLRYVPVRGMAALVTSLFVTWLLYPVLIARLRGASVGEVVRDDGPSAHQAKSGTPTMGGLLILIAVLVSMLVWGDVTNVYVLTSMGIFLCFGTIGFLDDWTKLVRKKGIRGKIKLAMQFAVALLFMGMFFYVFKPEDFQLHVYFPFMRIDRFYLVIPAWCYVLFAAVVVVAASNAVNLTDGLDGLAIFPAITAAGVFLVYAYLSGAVLNRFSLAEYLLIPSLVGANELAVLASALIGAGIGFLWYNSYPASIFMGDVGALPIGSLLGAFAVFTKNELLSVVILGLFVVEAMSSIIQTVSYKTRRKRVFKMAPIHHHFELKGLPEPKIVIRFWIISLLLGLIALSSIKVR